MFRRVKQNHAVCAGTGETHLVVQLMVQVGDERLVLRLLSIRQRDRGRSQAVNHHRRLGAAAAAFLVSAAQLLLHRYRLTCKSSDRLNFMQTSWEKMYLQ